ncbi:carbohydrate ABC transporter permease, partial [Rhizobium johnstonii]
MSKVSKRQIVFERTAVLVITVLFLLPVLWLITTAYKPSNQIFSIPPKLGFQPTLDQFRGI